MTTVDALRDIGRPATTDAVAARMGVGLDAARAALARAIVLGHVRAYPAPPGARRRGVGSTLFVLR